MAFNTVKHGRKRTGVIDAAGGSAGPSTLLDGLLGYWTLNETSGNRADSSGNSEVMQDNNGALFTASGKIGNAATLVRASNQYFGSDSTVIVAQAAFTFAGWVKFAGVAGTEGVASVSNTAGSGTPFMMIIRSTTNVQVYNGSSYINQGSGSVSAGTWYHVVATYDGTNAWQTILNNGTPGDATVASTKTEDNVTWLGTAFQGRLDGELDEWGAWNRVLTADEITALYNSGSGVTYPFS